MRIYTFAQVKKRSLKLEKIWVCTVEKDIKSV